MKINMKAISEAFGFVYALCLVAGVAALLLFFIGAALGLVFVGFDSMVDFIR